MPLVLAALLTLLLTLSPSRPGAHPGGRDSHGGHQVRQTGRYDVQTYIEAYLAAAGMAKDPEEAPFARAPYAL